MKTINEIIKEFDDKHIAFPEDDIVDERIDMKWIKIGIFTISGEYKCSITGKTKVLIKKDDGEGGEFLSNDIERIINKYYEKNF